jgi:hypothetical protein
LVALATAEEPCTPPGGDGLEPKVLADFVDLLRQQSMSAMERFSCLSQQLQRRLSRGSFELVRDHIDNLRFSDAADVLEGSQSYPTEEGQTRSAGLCLPPS